MYISTRGKCIAQAFAYVLDMKHARDGMVNK